MKLEYLPANFQVQQHIVIARLPCVSGAFPKCGQVLYLHDWLLGLQSSLIRMCVQRCSLWMCRFFASVFVARAQTKEIATAIPHHWGENQDI